MKGTLDFRFTSVLDAALRQSSPPAFEAQHPATPNSVIPGTTLAILSAGQKPLTGAEDCISGRKPCVTAADVTAADQRTYDLESLGFVVERLSKSTR